MKSITLTRTPTGKYYASVLVDDEKTEAVAITDLQSTQVVDVGLTDIAITSAGVKTGNPEFVKKAQRNLKRKQKKLSRCKKGSKGRAKARLLVAKAHAVRCCLRSWKPRPIGQGAVTMGKKIFKRVNNVVGSARSMGDHEQMGALSGRPKITRLNLFDGMILVQVSNGITQKATSDDIGSEVHDSLEKGKTRAQAATNVTEKALRSKVTDHLTTVVTRF